MFFRGQCRVQGLCNGAGNLFLYRKQIVGCQFAAIYFCPQVFIGICINKLHIDTHRIAGALDTTFDQRGNTELGPNGAHVFGRIPIFHDRGTGYHFQCANLCKLCEYVIVHTIDEKLAVGIGTAVGKGQYGYGFPIDNTGNSRCILIDGQIDNGLFAQSGTVFKTNDHRVRKGNQQNANDHEIQAPAGAAGH